MAFTHENLWFSMVFYMFTGEYDGSAISSCSGPKSLQAPQPCAARAPSNRAKFVQKPMSTIGFSHLYKGLCGWHTHTHTCIYILLKKIIIRIIMIRIIYTHISPSIQIFLAYCGLFPALVTPCSSILAYLRVPGSPSHVSCHDFLISWQWRWLSNNVTMSNRICKHYV